MPREVTPLTPAEEAQFQQWVRENGITDLDNPQSFYDYRGYWNATRGENVPKGARLLMDSRGDTRHYPDTYKQHGHPTFSIESQYSTGPFDGGRWAGEQYVRPGADLLMNSRGQTRLDPSMFRSALLAQMK